MKEINDQTDSEIVLTPTEIKFYPEKATSVLMVNNEEVNLELMKNQADKLRLTAKNEFHFTLIGNDTGEKILKLLEGQSETEKK